MTGPQLVTATALIMIAAQAAFRAWALLRSWFFTDDYRLMRDADASDLTAGYLFTPFDSQFMPVGRLIVWIVTHSGTTNWTLAAILTLVLQLLSSLAAWWMLRVLFGNRPEILLLLALYLTSALTLPGFMWWAAALNQLPLQLAFFVAVGCWISYVRERRARWLWLTLGAVGFGLLCYVKALLIVPVLVWLLLAYFATGSLWQRVRAAARSYPVACVAGSALAVGFLAFYVLAVPQPFEPGTDEGPRLAGEVAEAMLGTSLPTGALGGPWTWLNTSPPIVLAQPPGWSVHAAWVVVAALVAYGALRRSRTGRAWGLLASYALVAFVLLATSRGQLFGRLAGLEYRYLTDVLPVIVLSLGLAFLTLGGAVESSVPREPALLAVRVGPRLLAAGVAVVVVGGVASSLGYVRYWHEDNAGKRYVSTLQRDLLMSGPVDLADQVMPPDVMPEYTQPLNTTAAFVPLVADNARFPATTPDLHVVDANGEVETALITPGPRSVGRPRGDCGWEVTDRYTTIPLDNDAFDFTWWLRIGYLASDEDELEVVVAGERVTVPVRRGLHSSFINVEGQFSTITLGGLESGGTLCVDTIEVGQAAPENSE